MNKCDFCCYFNPHTNVCDDYKSNKRPCEEAIQIFAQVLVSQNNNTKTKTVNINKNNKKEK